MRLKPLLVCLLALLLAIQTTLPAQAIVTTTFEHQGEGLEEVVLELRKNEWQYLNLTFPAEEPTAASLTYGVTEGQARYPGGLTIHTPEHGELAQTFPYNHPNSLGLLGHQTKFYGYQERVVLFPSAHETPDNAGFTLPANATVETASLTLESLPAVEDAWHPAQPMAVQANAGSESLRPVLKAGGDGTIHLAWADRTNHPDYLDRFDILYRNFTDDRWSPTQTLGTFDSEHPHLGLAAEGTDLSLVWVDHAVVVTGEITFMGSDDQGVSWSAPTTILSGQTANAAYPEIAINEGMLHLVFQDSGDSDGDEVAESDILFSSSEDIGGNWSDPFVVSNGVQDLASHTPTLTTWGHNVTVVWSETGDHDNDGSNEADLVTRTSQDQGETWSVLRIIDDSDEESLWPTVGSDHSGRLHLSWYRHDTEATNSSLQYSRSENLGVTWEAGRQLSDWFPGPVLEPSALALNSPANVSVAWPQPAIGQELAQIFLRSSTDNGSQFDGGSTINLLAPASIRNGVALAYPNETALTAVWLDDQHLATGSGNWSGHDPDLWTRTLLEHEQSWSNASLLTDQFYPADSAQIQLAWGPMGQEYGLVWNEGEFNGNGDAHSPQGGDLFFYARETASEPWSLVHVLQPAEGQYMLGSKAWEAPRLVVDGQGTISVSYLTRSHSLDQWKIWFTSSTDEGGNWSTPFSIDTGPESITHLGMGVGEEHLHLVWKELNGSEPTLQYARSLDGGMNWEAPRELMNGTFSELLLDVDRERVLAGALHGAGSNFLISYDQGDEFSNYPLAWDASHYFDELAMVLHDGDILFAWTETDGQGGYVLNLSGHDIGWEVSVISSTTLVSSATPIHFPTLTSSPGALFLSYVAFNSSAGHYDLYLMWHSGGQKWSAPISISSLPNQEGLPLSGPPAMAIDQQLMVGWLDSSSVPIGHHQQAWTLSSNWTSHLADIDLSFTEYPTGTWSWEGELGSQYQLQWDESSTGTNHSMSAALQEALNKERKRIDELGIERAHVFLNSSSQEPGRLVLSELNITYTVDMTIENGTLLEALQEAAQEARSKGQAEATLKLAVKASLPGSLLLGDLKIITPHADMNLTGMALPQTAKVGQPLQLPLSLSNSGNNASRFHLALWYGPDQDTPVNHSQAVALGDWSGVIGANTEVNRTFWWQPTTEGEFWVQASIVSSAPMDRSLGNDNLSKRLTVVDDGIGPDPEIGVLNLTSLETDGPLWEGQKVNLTLRFLNPGSQSLEILDLRVFNGPSQLGRIQELVLVQDERFNWSLPWNLTSEDDLQLYWYEKGSPELKGQKVEVDVLAWPTFSNFQLEYDKLYEGPWDPLTLGSNLDLGLVAEFLGDVAISASSRYRLWDPEGNLVDESLGPTSLNPDVFHSLSKNYVVGQANLSDLLYGTYRAEYRLNELRPSQQTDPFFWPSDLNFSANLSFEITAPPLIELSNLTINDSQSESRIFLHFNVTNLGGTRANVDFELLVYPKGSAHDSSLSQVVDLNLLTLNPGQTLPVSHKYLVSGGGGREHTFRVQVRVVYPAQDPSVEPISTLTIEGIRLGEAKETDPNSLRTLLMILGSVVCMVVLLFVVLGLGYRFRKPVIWGVMNEDQEGGFELEPTSVEPAEVPPFHEGLPDHNGAVAEVEDPERSGVQPRATVSSFETPSNEEPQPIPEASEPDRETSELPGMNLWESPPIEDDDFPPVNQPRPEPQEVQEPWPPVRDPPIEPGAESTGQAETILNDGIPEPKPPGRETVTMPDARMENGPGAPEPVMVGCPDCGLRQMVVETTRPLHLRCTGCGEQMNLED